MSGPEHEAALGRALLAELQAIHASHRELLALAQAQHALAQAQQDRWERTAQESVSLQRLALQRQQHITRIAIPALLVCIALIGWLLWRWFL